MIKKAVRRGGRTQEYNVLYLCGRYYGVDWRERKDYFKITHKNRILLTQYLTFNMSQTATTSTNHVILFYKTESARIYLPW